MALGSSRRPLMIALEYVVGQQIIVSRGSARALRSLGPGGFVLSKRRVGDRGRGGCGAGGDGNFRVNGGR